MKVERQRHFECMLVTIAALADKPLTEIRTAACKKANILYWNEIILKGSITFWSVINYLTDRYSVKGIPRIIPFNATPGDTQAETLQGRGSISIGSPSKTEAHTMPFENGLIYDPANPDNPFPINALLDRYPSWIIIDITKE